MGEGGGGGNFYSQFFRLEWDPMWLIGLSHSSMEGSATALKPLLSGLRYGHLSQLDGLFILKSVCGYRHGTEVHYSVFYTFLSYGQF